MPKIQDTLLKMKKGLQQCVAAPSGFCWLAELPQLARQVALFVVNHAVLIDDAIGLVLRLVLGASELRDLRALLIPLPAGEADGLVVEDLAHLLDLDGLPAPLARRHEVDLPVVVLEVGVLILGIWVRLHDLHLSLAVLGVVAEGDLIQRLHVDADDLPPALAVAGDGMDENLQLIGTDVEVINFHLDLLLARETLVSAAAVALRLEFAMTLTLGRETDQALAVFAVEESEHQIPLVRTVRDDVIVGCHTAPPRRNM